MDAAEDLLCDQGSQSLTLAAVAERAGCSKGGLLYHFSTKEALIKGMVERLIEEFDDLVAAQGQDTYTKTTWRPRSQPCRGQASPLGGGHRSLRQPLPAHTAAHGDGPVAS
ncbi:TetR/AcrR family transcriptional regulator [Streptosporangium lutulentum]